MIELTLVTSVASLFISCQSRPERYCVDASQNVTDDGNCQDPNHRSYFHWYYVPSHGVVANGTHLNNGSATPPAEGFVSRSEAEGASERGVVGEAGEHAAGGAHGGGEAGE